MDSTVRRPPKRSIFDQAGPEPKCVSKFNQKLFSRSPPASPKSMSSPQPECSSSGVSLSSLFDDMLSQGRTDNEPMQAGLRDTAGSLDISERRTQQKDDSDIPMSAMGLSDEQEVVSPENVPSPVEHSGDVDMQDLVRDTPSEPAQEHFIISEALRGGETISKTIHTCGIS
jgi:hypothetical protein